MHLTFYIALYKEYPSTEEQGKTIEKAMGNTIIYLS